MPGHSYVRPTMSQERRAVRYAPAVARQAAGCGVGSAAGVLALQRAVGNSATVRALGLQRRSQGQLLQRAPLHLVMPLGHNLWYGQNEEHGYTVKPAVNPDIPEGYHVTIYPALSSAQQIAALSGGKLGELPDYESIEFTRFNVTTEDKRRAHYYFDDQGNVLWAQTKTEASLEDAHWDDAVRAALAIYGRIGVNVTAQELYDQLHRMGRQARVSQADTWGMPTSTAQPLSTGNTRMLVPPQLRKSRPQTVSKPVRQAAQAISQPQPVVHQPVVHQPQPQFNPFPFQQFVPQGWVPVQQLGPPVHPFVPPPQPFVPPPMPAQRGLGVQIGFDYARLLPPAQGGGNPLAAVPVFEHEEDMDTRD